jgi:hypothetical protein
MGNAVIRHLIGFHFGDQEYAVALAANHVAYQFLRAAITVIARRIDQGHSQRNARAQRFFFKSLWMPPLPETRGALTDRRDNGAVPQFNGPWWRASSKS